MERVQSLVQSARVLPVEVTGVDIVHHHVEDP